MLRAMWRVLETESRSTLCGREGETPGTAKADGPTRTTAPALGPRRGDRDESTDLVPALAHRRRSATTRRIRLLLTRGEPEEPVEELDELRKNATLLLAVPAVAGEARDRGQDLRDRRPALLDGPVAEGALHERVGFVGA